MGENDDELLEKAFFFHALVQQQFYAKTINKNTKKINRYFIIFLSKLHGKALTTT